MIKKTIYIGNPSYLKLKQNQMLIEDAETKTIKGTVPIEDMASVGARSFSNHS